MLMDSKLQSKKQADGEKSQWLQVIHCHGNHWILTSTVHDKSSSRVLVYDSLYNNIDAGTLTIICNLFGATAMPQIVKTQRQQGVTDCGIFAIICNNHKNLLSLLTKR